MSSVLQDILKKDICSLSVSVASLNIAVGDPFENVKRIANFVHYRSKEKYGIIMFQELSLTGSTCGSLFLDESFLQTSYDALMLLVPKLPNSGTIVFVGLPLKVEGVLYNCVVAIQKGQILFINVLPPSEHSYSAFKRYEGETSSILFNNMMFVDEYGNRKQGDVEVPFGTNISLNLNVLDKGCNWHKTLKLGCISDASIADSLLYDLSLFFSSSPSVLQDGNCKLEIAKSFSKVYGNAMLFCGSSYTENSCSCLYYNDVGVFEEGQCLAKNSMLESSCLFNRTRNVFIDAWLDVGRIWKKRGKKKKNAMEVQTDICSSYGCDSISRLPYIVPFRKPAPVEIDEYVARLFDMVSLAVSSHLESLGIQKCVLGLSGGIDSTMALLFLVRSFFLRNEKFCRNDKWRRDIHAFTLPCFGSSETTKQNAISLCNILGCNIEEIDIKTSVLQHFKDIGQRSTNYDVTFENAQARERCQVLMDKANMLGAVFIGSSDLSEITLGFSTYAGDHMSMYNILGSIPKTVLRFCLRYASKMPELFVEREEDAPLFSEIISSVLAFPISPELLPQEDGRVVQKTESILGSYTLHDFFIYHIFKNHYSAKKVLYLAIEAFGYFKSEKEILSQLLLFYKRFFASQFKRNCMPECPDVTGLSFVNWQMSSNVAPVLYCEELEELDSYAKDAPFGEVNEDNIDKYAKIRIEEFL